MSQLTQSSETGTASAATRDPQPALPIRWGRIALISLPLIVLSTGWIANSEMKTGVTEITISSLFMGVTFMLFVLTLLNLLVRRLAGPRSALNQPELMVVYTLLSMASVVGGVGSYGFFTPFLANPFYYDTPQNGWQSWWHLLPSVIGPRDPAVLKGFFNGRSTFFQPHIMAAWAYPAIAWSIFFLLLLWTTLCLAAIVRRRWADEEHLPFPVIALPLEMTREGAPLYKNRLLWLGFAIPACLHSLNSLQSIYPTLPTMQINSEHDLVWLAGLQSPWSGMGSFFYQLHPAGVGFGFLLNTDVSFSLWFFYLLKKAVDVWAVAWDLRDVSLGWHTDGNGQFPYLNAQSWGAWLTLGLSVLWVGRGYFRAYFLRAWHGDKEGVDAGEPMSPRVAVLGFLVGFFALCAFVWSWGGSWWLPVVYLLIYLLLMITLSRLRAETAVLSSELVWVDPQDMISSVIGAGSLSHANLVHMGALSWFNLDYRASGMPHELEGLVGQERTRGRMSPLVTAMMVAAAISMVAALLWDLQMYYVNGAATGRVNSWRVYMGQQPWVDVQNWLQNPQPVDWHLLAGLAFGVGMTMLLSAMRARFVGFPLHPAGYALNTTFANDFFWCDMFVAWLIKAFILRYGGMNLYRQALPFFLGLILGDFVTGSIWSIIGTIFHLNLFRTFAT